jgi:uncharacterized protein YjiS (DUF1127 family)
MAMITDRIAYGFLRSYQRPSRVSFWAVAASAVGDLVTRLLGWQERARQRRQLLALDRAALKDFGQNSAAASREGDKPFWRA